ncbi:MAG TPA: LptA/OstA family protein [Terriglobales bacterium]|nr:LptA/OstA family protein [Terriglobales bacterium]
MASSITRLRRWFAVGAVLMIAVVAGMYFYAQWRVRKVVHDIPAKIGLDIQQTAEGFSISKSVEGRTLFTVSASKALQFKEGGRATLHNVKIVIYGRDAGRFDQITGDEFDYDPASGNVSAKGRVLIDLEANPEGLQHLDQSAPEQNKDPIHLETNGLIFNKNTGDASATGKVTFETPQASGSAVGIRYEAKAGILNLLSSVVLNVSKPRPLLLNALQGTIEKQPRQVVLTGVHIDREQQKLRADRSTFFLRPDNTVDHILAEGNVESEFQRRASAGTSTRTSARTSSTSNSADSKGQSRSDRAELWLTGTKNQLTTAVLSGNVQLVSEGAQPADGSAGKVTLHFGEGQLLKTVHAEDGVRLVQKKSGTAPIVATASAPVSAPVSASGASAEQDVEMTAPTMDFTVKDGRLLQSAETTGPPQIAITQPGANQKTVVRAAKFTAKFTATNRLASLHGEPDAKIVSGKISGAPSDRISTSQMLDVIFGPQGGIASITQSGSLAYVDGLQKAWAQRGEYTTADQMLVLSGSPRVVDNGVTTTAQTLRLNRATGDATAEGNVKSTYSELKAQPDGGMLASGDPIHVTSHTMTAHRSTAIALYSGDAQLWQNANVVEAPSLEFDRDKRSLVAQGTPAQPVSTVLVQVDKTGKVTPVAITSAHLTYADAARKVLLDGGVTAKGSDSTITAQQMTVYLMARNQSAAGKPAGGVPATPGQVERIVAENHVVVTQPARHANGERLVYTAAEDSFVLTGGAADPPSIFDAERGKITGDSLTFYRHDDRVLVEGKETSPTVTRTQVAR